MTQCLSGLSVNLNKIKSTGLALVQSVPQIILVATPRSEPGPPKGLSSKAEPRSRTPAHSPRGPDLSGPFGCYGIPQITTQIWPCKYSLTFCRKKGQMAMEIYVNVS